MGQMDALGVSWPEAHYNADMMVKLGGGQAKVFGFEAVRAPFCLTVEIDSLNVTKVDPGRKDRTPMVKGHPFALEDDPALMPVNDFLKNGRARHGQSVRLVDHLRGTDLLCEVTHPVFFDAEGGRARG